MLRARKFGFAAALSAGFVAVTLAAAPTAMASTPTANSAMSHPASTSTVRLVDYQSGYKEGYRDGLHDGKEACNNRSAKKKLSNTDKGYVDGYNAGFSKSQYECNGDG